MLQIIWQAVTTIEPILINREKSILDFLRNVSKETIHLGYNWIWLL